MTDWETRYYEAEALHTEANGMLTAENERLRRALSDGAKLKAFMEGEIVKATERYEQAVIDRNETDAVLDKLRDILHRTAIALKGPEDELSRHSFHDLPEVAASRVTYAELLAGLLNGARAFVDDEAYAAKIDAALSSHYLQGASIREDEGEAHDAYAARYRWLRDHAITVEQDGPLVFNADKTGKPSSSSLTHERLDRAVDLAMERGKCVHAINR